MATMKIQVGAKNHNRLGAGTHTKRRVLEAMGFRFAGRDRIVDPETGDPVPLSRVECLAPRARGRVRTAPRRPLYPDEEAALRAREQKLMARAAAAEAKR